jgi:26S proteasome regulatory subunit N6
MLEYVGKVPNTTDLQIEMCNEWVEWSKAEKRSFLRQSIELRLASLYVAPRDERLPRRR